MLNKSALSFISFHIGTVICWLCMWQAVLPYLIYQVSQQDASGSPACFPELARNVVCEDNSVVFHLATVATSLYETRGTGPYVGETMGTGGWSNLTANISLKFWCHWSRIPEFV